MGTNLGVEEFCWGRKEKLVEEEYLLIDKLYIKRGGYSSIHFHRDQINQMIIISGAIGIIFYQNQKYLDSEYLIKNNISKVIDIGIAHKFRGEEDSVVIEIIKSIRFPVSRDDIVRLTERGIESANK